MNVVGGGAKNVEAMGSFLTKGLNVKNIDKMAANVVSVSC